MHSLFTPLLSFIIEYLNQNKENKNKKQFIGKSKVLDIEVIYSLLNKEIYNLFFKKEKGKIFEGNEEINYELESEDENYYISSIKEKTITKKVLKDSLEEMIGEKVNLSEQQTLEKLFDLKRKEIISTFRLGYSLQERIINFLHSKSGNELIELPNIIFYKSNKEKKIFNEMDRIITVKKDIQIKEFLVYLKAKFSPKTQSNIQIYEMDKPQILSFEKDSCNYIEVKNSINSFIEKEEKSNDEKPIIIKSPSNNSSHHSSQNYFPKKKKNKNKIYQSLKAFKNLLENIKLNFNVHNLIIIIDSYFPKNFVKIAREYIEKWKDEEIYFEFNVYFVHFEINIEYIYQINEFEKFNIDLKKKDEEIKKLQDDSNKKDVQIKELQDDSNLKDEEIKKLQDDSIKKDVQIKELQDNTKNTNEKLNKLERELKKKDIKKKIQKDIKLYIEEELKIYKSKFTVENCLIIIKHKIPFFDFSQKLENEIDKKYKNLFDFKTFCLIYYKDENKDLIDYINEKHIKNFKKLSEIKNLNTIYLFVDFVFLYSLKDFFANNENYEIKIYTVLNKYFMVKITKKSDKNKNTCVFLDKILGSDNNNMFDFVNLKNFTNYYLESLLIKNNRNIQNYPIYDPIKNECDYYITIEERKELKNQVMVFCVDPIYEYEDLPLNLADDCKYILIIYKTYAFPYEEKIFKNIRDYFNFLNNIPDGIYQISDDEPIVIEDDNMILKKSRDKDIAYIIDKREGRIKYKYKIKSNNKVDENSFIDKNIEFIMKSISKFDENKEIKVLIEEPYNLISTYIKAKYKNWKIVLLNDTKNDNIHEYISTNIENKINNINIYSYINYLKEEKFDIIILENNCFPDKDNDIVPKDLFTNEKNLINIKNILNIKGEFYFNLLAKNRYSKEKIENKLRKIFNKIDIFKNFELNSIIVCSEN